MIEDTDYTVSYSKNESAGTANIEITGTGNYKDRASTSFEITSKNADDTNIKIVVEDIENQVYTGEEIKPGVTIIDTDR